MFDTARGAFDRINLWMGYVAGLGNLVMGLMLFFEVIMRYFLGSPTIWTGEISGYIFIWTMFVGAAYTLRQGKHIRIDLLITYLPEKTRTILDVFTGVVGFVFCILVTYQSWEMVSSAVLLGKLSTTPLRVPQWIPQSSMVIGFAFLSLQYFFIVVDLIVKLRKGGESA